MTRIHLRRAAPAVHPVLAAAFVLASLPALGEGAAAQAPGPSAAHSPDEAARTITAERLLERISFFAADSLRGRDTPSPGLETAARHVVEEYRGFGLEPAGENGTFFQRYPFLHRRLDASSLELHLRTPRGDVALEPGEEFFVAGGTDGPVVASAAFAGADEAATERRSELAGRVAIAAAGGARGAGLFELAQRQARAAEEAGARAIVHVLDESWTAGQLEEMAGRLATPRWVVGEEGPSFAQVFVAREAARRALSDVPGGERVLEGGDPGAGEPLSDLEVVLRAEHEVLERAEPPNVAGVLRGRDPELAGEYVILSAHLDHVGVGQAVDGDSIYNGADDNGSGTSALMEVARALSELGEGERPRRSVLFLHVSGEEKGLLGSRWYSDHPTVDLGAVAANVNVDMVAGDRHTDTLVVIGKEYSSLGPLVEEVNGRHPDLGLVASDDLWPEQRFFFRSDHFNFARKEIPALFFFTGVHECYHRPCDELDFVDPEKGARVARLLFHTVLEIANRDERPSWDPDGLREVRELTGSGR